MTENVKIEWLACYSTAASVEDGVEKYFSRDFHASLFSQVGVPEPLWIAPERFRPKQGFHRLVTRSLDSFLDEQVRLPYDSIVLGANLKLAISNIALELFPGEVSVARVSAKLIDPPASTAETLELLSRVRSPKGIPVLDDVLRGLSTGLFGSSELVASRRYSSYFAFEIRSSHTRDELDGLEHSLRQPLVSLLIGSGSPESVRDGIVERVWAASEELNAKAAAEILLLNRQGLINLLPRGDYEGPHRHRFSRTLDLAVIASYARHFLREGHDFAMREPVTAADVVRRMRQWVNFPRATFDASVSNTWSWVVLAEQFLLSERLDAWEDFFSVR